MHSSSKEAAKDTVGLDDKDGPLDRDDKKKDKKKNDDGLLDRKDKD